MSYEWTDPCGLLHGTTVVTVPHMDDEVLACGGTIARLANKDQIHLIYATDGSKSPTPSFRWLGSASLNLAEIREKEAKDALRILGVPKANLSFLRLPDGKLRQHLSKLTRSLIDFFSKLKPNNILMPFRYDRHPDHVALHRATLQALECLTPRIQVLEYFVYYRWKLLPEKDVRKYVRPDHLIAVNIQAGSESKRRALDCFQSQTTKFFPWQYRPNLTRAFLDEVCREPELFLRHDPSFPERSIFTRAHTWIRVAHVAEPLLKRWKDEARIVLHARGRQDKPKA